MRKLLFWGAAALLAAVSCNKELENTTPVLPEGDRVSFVATVDGAATKTVMGEIDVKGKSAESLWDGIEAIRVLDGSVSKEFTSENVSKVKTATFTENDNEVILTGDDYLAVYPAAPAGYVSWSGDIAEPLKYLWLTDNQKAVQSSFDPSAHIAVAYAEAGNNNLYFKNVVSLISFTIGSDNVSEVKISGNNNEIIAGNFDLTYDPTKESIVIDATNETYYTSKSVSLKAEEGNLSKGKVYYVALLPNNFTDGITVETIIDGVASSKKTKAFNLKRNAVVSLGLVEWEAPAWGIRGSMNNWGDTPDIAMSLNGDWYVAEDVELKATDEFKFYYDDGSQYGAWIGATNDTPAKVGETTLGGDSNISVELPGIYTVSLSKDNKTMALVKTADLELDVIDPATAGVDKVRVGLTGNKAAWNWGDPSAEKGSLATFSSKNVTNAENYSGTYTFAMTDVEFAANEQFKIRVDIDGQAGWYGNGTSVTGISCTYSDDGNFIVSSAGTYDIAISFTYNGETQSASNISAAFTKTSVDPEPEPDPEPETKTLCLNPGVWNTNGAWFAAYFYGNGEKWVKMEDTDGDGIYECTPPEDYPSVIFCRMDNAKTALEWDSKWNQSEDLTVPTTFPATYSITGWGEWKDYGNGEWKQLSTGEWK